MYVSVWLGISLLFIYSLSRSLALILSESLFFPLSLLYLSLPICQSFCLCLTRSLSRYISFSLSSSLSLALCLCPFVSVYLSPSFFQSFRLWLTRSTKDVLGTAQGVPRGNPSDQSNKRTAKQSKHSGHVPSLLSM